MTNDTNLGNFMELPKVRVGLKREFANAMRAQSEICNSLGRTRSNNTRNVIQVPNRYARKRFRKSSSFKVKQETLASLARTEKDISDASSKEEKKGDMLNDQEHKSQVANKTKVVLVCDKNNRNGELKSITETEAAIVISEEKHNNDEPKSEEENEVAIVVSCEDNKNDEPKTEVVQIQMQSVHDYGGVENEGRDSGVVPILGCKANPVKRFMQQKPKKVKDGDGKMTSDGIEKEDEGGFMTDASTIRRMSKGFVDKKFPSTLKDLLSSGILEGLHVNYVRGLKVNTTRLSGVISGNGVICYCEACNGVDVVTPTIFELHAGSLNKRPSEYIFIENGGTLRDLMNTFLNIPSITLEEAVQRLLGNFLVKKSKFCVKCREPVVLPNSLNHGMKRNLSHSKSQGKITRKDLRLHKLVFEADVLKDGTELAYYAREKQLLVGYKRGSGIVCSCCECEVSPSQFEAHAGWASRRKPGQDFSKSFGPRTVIICDQELPEGNWFCCLDCDQIHTTLENLVARGEEILPDSLVSLIRKKYDDKGLKIRIDLDIKWRVLNWKMADTKETRQLLSKVVAIFHEQFDPIIHSTTGIDYIPTMLFGRNIKGQDFSGMYCALLIVNQKVVSAGVFRVFGPEVAELPLVATIANCQGQGYFQSLFCCIEGLLRSLKVKHFVLPAADEAVSIWTNKFGFTKLNQDEINNYRRYYYMMIFQGTSLLHKPILDL
ncbi:hypothetical protein VNO78_05769 [Psophocarpus tetragonolobus]|uniref:Tify domain-containing protein n=1 Tax=Psophocarpus tetragonolobus TaxID=3891 RepID=A0AAN9SSC9_PSOTE